MKRKYLVILVTVLLLVAVALPVGAQTIWQTYGNVRAKQLDVLGATTLRGATTAAALTVTSLTNSGAASATTVTATGLQVNGNGVVTGTLTSTGALGVATRINYVPQAIFTVVEAEPITPTGTLQLLTAAGSVTAPLAAGSAGQVLVLLNTAAQTITIADTTGQLLSGNIALGQWDVATLVYYGTAWIQVSESDN
jgi:hypothetical protein